MILNGRRYFAVTFCSLIAFIGVVFVSCGRLPTTPINVATAPTAVILKHGKTFVGVVDSAATAPETICVSTDHYGPFTVVLAVEDERVMGEWAIVDLSGHVQVRDTFGGGNEEHELHGQASSVGITACVQLVATQGLSVFRLRWYTR